MLESLPELENSWQRYQNGIILLDVFTVAFLKTTDRGGLKIPGDKVCQWTFYSYIVFHEVVNDTCRTS